MNTSENRGSGALPPVPPPGHFRIVNGKRHRVEVALVVKSGFLNELLVLRIVVDGVKRLAADLPDPAVIDVQKSVRSRQEPGWLGWRMLAQLDGKYNRRGDNHDRQDDRESASNSHEMRARREMIALTAWVSSGGGCTPTWRCGTLYNCPGHLEGIRGIRLRGSATFPSVAGVAQSVEHLICNQRVGGSIPFASSKNELDRAKHSSREFSGRRRTVQ